MLQGLLLWPAEPRRLQGPGRSGTGSDLRRRSEQTGASCRGWSAAHVKCLRYHGRDYAWVNDQSSTLGVRRQCKRMVGQAGLCVGYEMAFHCVLGTEWPFIVCWVRNGLSLCVRYGMAFHCVLDTEWPFIVCWVRNGLSLCVGYGMAFHCVLVRNGLSLCVGYGMAFHCVLGTEWPFIAEFTNCTNRSLDDTTTTTTASSSSSSYSFVGFKVSWPVLVPLTL
jgi:hypothetical protein